MTHTEIFQKDVQKIYPLFLVLGTAEERPLKVLEGCLPPCPVLRPSPRSSVGTLFSRWCRISPSAEACEPVVLTFQVSVA